MNKCLADIHVDAGAVWNVHQNGGATGINSPEIGVWLWIWNKDGAQRLRDALDEILVGVPVPPEDEVIGLTDGGEDEDTN